MTPAAATGGVEAPEVADRFVDRGPHGVRAADVTDHAVDGRAVPGHDLVEMRLGGQAVLQRRIVGGGVDGDGVPAGRHQRVDRRRADASGRARDDGHRAHVWTSASRDRRRQVGDQGFEEGEPLLRTRSRGVAQHAVGRYRPHPLGAQTWQQPVDGLGAARLGEVQAHGSGVEGQHQRRLGAPRVRITPGHDGAPHQQLVAVGVTAPRHVGQRRLVAPVGVHQQDAAEGGAGAADELDEERRQGLVPDEQSARECGVLAAGPVGDRRCDDDARPAGRQPGGEGVGDPGVGIEREMRPVLLERTQGQRQQGSARRRSTSRQVACPSSTSTRSAGQP